MLSDESRLEIMSRNAAEHGGIFSTENAAGMFVELLHKQKY